MAAICLAMARRRIADAAKTTNAVYRAEYLAFAREYIADARLIFGAKA